VTLQERPKRMDLRGFTWTALLAIPFFRMFRSLRSWERNGIEVLYTFQQGCLFSSPGDSRDGNPLLDSLRRGQRYFYSMMEAVNNVNEDH
jgi:hypothetical protein